MKRFWILTLAVLCLGIFGCTKPEMNNDNTEPATDPVETPEDKAEKEKQTTYKYVNIFARNMMNLWYLWTKDIQSDLEAWKDTEDPKAKVEKIRYKDDRWTMVTDDFSSFYGSVTGNEKTYGFDFSLLWADKAHTTLWAVVTYTYPDSPAAKAGLKRGDYITNVNGKTMNQKTYTNIVYNELLGGDKVTLSIYNGKDVTLTAQEMYENPVILFKTFDNGAKKVGYLVYTSFTLESYKDLIPVCLQFREEGVSELILDLRYNGGGFVIAEQVLASMLAPEDAVKRGDVMATEVYNDAVTEAYGSDPDFGKTYFTTEFDYPEKFSTDGANIGLDKIYAIVASGSASASEALLCDLYPYMDITLVGEQTHGKFCSGQMLQAEDFYDDYADQLKEMRINAATGKKYVKNWGLYVMISRFADKNGETRCMPNGLTPDYEVADDPQDGCQLGDPDETMLSKALELCGFEKKAKSARRSAGPKMDRLQVDPFRPEFGMRILPTHRR